MSAFRFSSGARYPSLEVVGFGGILFEATATEEDVAGIVLLCTADAVVRSAFGATIVLVVAALDNSAPAPPMEDNTELRNCGMGLVPVSGAVQHIKLTLMVRSYGAILN